MVLFVPELLGKTNGQCWVKDPVLEDPTKRSGVSLSPVNAGDVSPFLDPDLSG